MPLPKHLLLAILVFFSSTVSAAKEEKSLANALADLPLEKLLMQKKLLSETSRKADRLKTSPHVAVVPPGTVRHQPSKKTFHGDYPDSEKWLEDTKSKNEVKDVLNTSITVLSYLAFGGYILCMVVAALREKRRRFTMAFPRPANAQLANVLQQYMVQRPIRVKFPAVTVNEAGRKRKKRSGHYPYSKGNFMSDTNPVYYLENFLGVDDTNEQ